MKTPVETLRKLLVGIGWQPAVCGDSSTFVVDFRALRLPITGAVASVRSDPQRFLFYLHYGATVSPARRDEAVCFLTRANCGLAIGNFEMDWEEGLVRFKTSVDFTGGALTETLIQNAILSAMHAVEVYSKPLLLVLRGELDAASAIQDAQAHIV
jgi:hypothetical protein